VTFTNRCSMLLQLSACRSTSFPIWRLSFDHGVSAARYLQHGERLSPNLIATAIIIPSDRYLQAAINSYCMANPPTHKTRIVCISDTHNQQPSLPKGDILIHAGDLTNQGSASELTRALKWLEKQDFEVKVVIAGKQYLCTIRSIMRCLAGTREPRHHTRRALLR